MTRTFLLAAAFAGVTATAAFAQDVILLPEEEVMVREYIVQQPRNEIVVPDGYNIVVGEALPDTVTVSPLDAPGFAKKFEYVVIDGRTVLIDPETREVVKVLD